MSLTTSREAEERAHHAALSWAVLAVMSTLALVALMIETTFIDKEAYRRGYCESRGGAIVDGGCVRVIAMPEGQP